MRKAWILGVAVLAATACKQGEEAEKVTEDMSVLSDMHSYSKPEQAKVEHLDWKAEVDFNEKVIYATATWTLADGAKDRVIFDTHDLNIESVVDEAGNNLVFDLSERDETFGQALSIELPENTRQISIKYVTSPTAKALQWTAPEQTEDKIHPFLYTQSQAILARTWIPCQDSPGIRFTYKAEVKVDPALLALMSASNPQSINPEGVYQFDMPQPIPSYLLALAVGDLYFKPVGPKTGVYAEGSVVDTAAYEFADMQKMLEAAEALYGEYQWGRYDLIVLPPSFPFGGMENPRLTFATPTILAGDRSLGSLVAHELAHSWSGNLVTNATWNDFWLNEGFTVYFEHRIMEAVYGRDYSEMLASLGHEGLLTEIDDFMSENPDDTKLKIDLTGRNPDDGVTAIAYDKGYHFLRLIEETVGRERFDVFLKSYFSSNAFQVMDTERFLGLLRKNLVSPEEEAQIGIEEWVYGTGLPSNAPVPDASRFIAVDAAAQSFLDAAKLLPPAEQTEGWSTHEWLRFLAKLSEADVERLKILDQQYAFTESNNSEVVAAWLGMNLKQTEVSTAVDKKAEEFLVRVGRRKFLTPTYKAMIEGGHIDRAREIYSKARSGYHAVARETLDKLLESEA
jgi:leukotriene-A4 hydrolase